MSITTEQLETTLKARFSGLLRKGSHSEDGEACALELLSVVRGIRWTDNPLSVKCWDLRALNDIDVSDEVRTEHIMPVLAAYANCMDWPIERQIAVVSALAIGTMRYLIAELPGLSPEIATQCREAETLGAVHNAANAVHNAADVNATSAANAARNAANAANAAGYAAEYAVNANVAGYAAEYAVGAARNAASYAARNAANAASYAARNAANVANVAGYAASYVNVVKVTSDRQQVFIRACQVWITAAGLA